MAAEEGLGGSLEGMDLMDLAPWDGDYNDFLADLLPEDDGARGDAAVPSSSQDASGSAGGACCTPLKHQGHPSGGCDGGSLLDPGALFGPGADPFPGSPSQQVDVLGAAPLTVKDRPASSTQNCSIASSGTSGPSGRGSPQASSQQQEEIIMIHQQQRQQEDGQCATAQQRHQSLPNQQHPPPQVQQYQPQHQRPLPTQAGKGQSFSLRHELPVQPVQQFLQQQTPPPSQATVGDDSQHRRSVSYPMASVPCTQDVAGKVGALVPLPLLNSFSGELNGMVPVMAQMQCCLLKSLFPHRFPSCIVMTCRNLL